MTELQVKEITTWLFVAFSKYGFISDLYLIGSILHSEHLINDVDIVQNIYFDKSHALKQYADSLVDIKTSFLGIFSTPLHITTFTQNESCQLVSFMSKNIYLKII